MAAMNVDSDEDEEVDVGGDEEGDDEDEAGPVGGLITPEQLSAALAMAGATAATSAAGTSGTAASSASSQDSGFREFLGSLLAAEGPQTSGAGKNYTPPSPSWVPGSLTNPELGYFLIP